MVAQASNERWRRTVGRMNVGSLYASMFRAVYRGLRAANGPREAHEYIAALWLSLCAMLNTCTLASVYGRWAGVELRPLFALTPIMTAYGAFFVVHYLTLIRGRPKKSFQSKEGPSWAWLAALVYVLASIFLFIASG